MKQVRLTKEDLACLRHCLTHLEYNAIDNPDAVYGWYLGARANFLKRHVKAKTLLRRLTGQDKP